MDCILYLRTLTGQRFPMHTGSLARVIFRAREIIESADSFLVLSEPGYARHLLNRLYAVRDTLIRHPERAAPIAFVDWNPLGTRLLGFLFATTAKNPTEPDIPMPPELLAALPGVKIRTRWEIDPSPDTYYLGEIVKGKPDIVGAIRVPPTPRYNDHWYYNECNSFKSIRDYHYKLLCVKAGITDDMPASKHKKLSQKHQPWANACRYARSIARQDMKRLMNFKNDRLFHLVCIAVLTIDHRIIDESSVWGIESDCGSVFKRDTEQSCMSDVLQLLLRR